MARIDVLIPTFSRPAALAVTLTGLVGQSERDFRVVVSDQPESAPATASGEVKAVTRVLRAHGHDVEFLRHLPRRGMAEKRQFLLDQAKAQYVLYLDDDLILESDVIARMLDAITRERCGFVGCAAVGLSYLDDERPHEQNIDFWDGPVCPELVEPRSPTWERHRPHNAATLYHVQQRVTRADETRMYRVAWVGGCVLYDADCLRAVGGFGFWRELPADHSGEDALAQMRVMKRFGGCGLISSGVYHQELATTLQDRRVDAPKYLDIGESGC